MVTCANCGKKVNEAEAYPVIFKRDKAGQDWICEECYSDDVNSCIATAVIVEGGEKVNFARIGNYAYECDYDEYEDLIEEYGKRLKWCSTDSWRGFFTGQPDSLVKVLDSWFGIDGHWGSPEVGKFHRKFEIEEDLPEFVMLVTFPRTSNVCACAIEVWVEKEHIEDFRRWLES